MSSAVTKAPRRGRTFTGCWTCRGRKVKCDERQPACTPCQKGQLECAGYDSRLVWKTEDQKYKPNGRRYLHCESTWRGTQLLKPDELDHVIALCDAAEYAKMTGVQWDPATGIPFHVFPRKNTEEAVAELITPIPPSLVFGRRLKNEEGFLFQHYTQHVAFMMMPYEDRRNPWATSYSQAAFDHATIEQKALYNGLLAQAAINLARLDCSRKKMELQAVTFYHKALQYLRESITKPSGHSPDHFASFLAAAMTLMMYEIYKGETSWKTHLNASIQWLQQQPTPTPWRGNDFAWASAQSLCLIKVLSDTTTKPNMDPSNPSCPINPINHHGFREVRRATDFGFTVGATSEVLNCIADITNFNGELQFQHPHIIREFVQGVNARLQQCYNQNEETLNQRPCPGEPLLPFQNKIRMEYHHINAFIAATSIYLYRSVFNCQPCQIQACVVKVFDNIESFFEAGDGNLTLWPGFIAAVECYEEKDLRSARTWLDRAMKVGMGNRLKVREIIEEVWRKRDLLAKETRQEKGCVVVDWRDVMQERGIDVLLA